MRSRGTTGATRIYLRCNAIALSMMFSAVLREECSLRHIGGIEPALALKCYA
jgi:hypothetical protein